MRRGREIKAIKGFLLVRCAPACQSYVDRLPLLPSYWSAMLLLVNHMLTGCPLHPSYWSAVLLLVNQMLTGWTPPPLLLVRYTASQSKVGQSPSAEVWWREGGGGVNQNILLAFGLASKHIGLNKSYFKIILQILMNMKRSRLYAVQFYYLT